MICPVCHTEDAVRTKDAPAFYRDGHLVARCFHGNSHPNGGPVDFILETGEVCGRVELTHAESLYLAARQGTTRGFGAPFLAKCGIYAITAEDVAASSSLIPTEKWMRTWQAQEVPVIVAPLYKGAQLSGLEVRAMQEATSVRPGEAAPKTQEKRKTVGEGGIYVANPGVQPTAVLAFAGLFDAVTAAWDAFQEGSFERYAFVAYSDGTNANLLRDTLEALFPGVPRLIVSDQDPSGQKTRSKFAKAGTLAILPGAGLAKDYRDAEPKKRWAALMDGVERAMDNGNPTGEEVGVWKVARRALDGALRAKGEGMRDLEAWRFGQRCAGICKAAQGGKKFFSIRGALYGRTPVAEGLHEFEPILGHSLFQHVQKASPNLAAIIQGGATESPMSPEWRAPAFLPDGRHWSEIPTEQRKALAVRHGWEPWTSKDIGKHLPDDFQNCWEAVLRAYTYTVIPGVPASEVGSRVFMLCLAAAMCAMRAEECWVAGLPMGFQPWLWFFGEGGTGKGTASEIIAAMVSGDTQTYGSQRFGGESKDASWLTESVLHLPVAFRDELDQFLESGALEDLKTFIGGKAIEKRKAYGVSMTIAPRPVVFATNKIKINADDHPTKERIILCQLDKNPMVPDKARQNAFETFHEWMQAGGAMALHRVAIQAYKAFRNVPIGRSTFTRSASFDTAMAQVCARTGYQLANVMAPAQQNKEEAILHGATWYMAIKNHIQYDLGKGDILYARASEIWSTPGDESGKRRLRRYLDQFHDACAKNDGALSILGFRVSLVEDGVASTLRQFKFEREVGHAITA